MTFERDLCQPGVAMDKNTKERDVVDDGGSMKGIHDLVFFTESIPEFTEEPILAAKLVRGNPIQRTWHHFTSDDGKLFVGIWEAEPGCWKVKYSENEYCRILSGRSLLRDRDGNEHPLEAGDDFVIPRGFSGEWEVVATTRKIYVIYQP
jgi:uncharacterized protein